jgi:hypothetical protein
VGGCTGDNGTDGLCDAGAEAIVSIRGSTEGQHPVGAIPGGSSEQVAVGVIRVGGGGRSAANFTTC